MAEKIVILGAGAIGRGYLPWMLSRDYELIFVDVDDRVVKRMRDKGHYVTYRVRDERLESRRVPVAAAYTTSDFVLSEHSDVAACFFCVGPRNVAAAARLFRSARVPTILCENDPSTVAAAKQALGHEQVYFAVPDVITSSTAPEHMLKEDPLSVVTENGELFIEDGAAALRGDVKFLPVKELLGVQWTAKLYLHNTPHCIAAYLGALASARYVHEAMHMPEIAAVVSGAMDEMLKSLKMKWDIPHQFLEWYADKELARFRCKMLFDPVSRVAREPLRKLEMDGRLIGAAQICLSLGIIPANILTGITGALLFESKADPDRHLAFLRRSLPSDAFNRYILGFRAGEPLDLLLRERIDTTLTKLEELQKVSVR